ncbi:SGNH/GDSL hydrolase family protein [Myxococcota bacterium]|nr:SGNH/GDSL hydrolase family protein [Myxococcota bacterium]
MMRGALSRVLLLFVSSVLTLLVAEGLVRWLDLGPEIQPVYRENFQLSAHPGLRYELKPGSRDREHRINSEGMRGPEVLRFKPPGTFRIAVIGDSIAFGYEVDANRTFAALIERVLNRDLADSDRRFEVINFGVPGYGIDQAVKTLEKRVLDFEPDLVIYAYCLNDAQSYSLEFENLLARTTHAERGYLEDLATRQLRLYALIRYALQSVQIEGRLYGETQHWHRDDPQFKAIETGDYRSYYADLYRDPDSRQRVSKGFDELGEISARHDLPILVVVFPVFIQLPNYALAETHRELALMLARRSLASVDLTEIYRIEQAIGDDKLHRDPLHPSAQGHRVAAYAILYELLENAWLGEMGGAGFESLRMKRKGSREFLDRLGAAMGGV